MKVNEQGQRDYEIGEVFEEYGKRIVVVEDRDKDRGEFSGCHGCFFDGKFCGGIACGRLCRSDGKDVIFEPVKEEKNIYSYHIRGWVLNAIMRILFYLGAMKKTSVTEDGIWCNHHYEFRKWHPLTWLIYAIFVAVAFPPTVISFFRENKIEFTDSKKKK